MSWMKDMPIWFFDHTDSKLEVSFKVPYTDRMKNKNNVNNPINLWILAAGSLVVIINVIAFALMPR